MGNSSRETNTVSKDGREETMVFIGKLEAEGMKLKLYTLEVSIWVLLWKLTH